MPRSTPHRDVLSCTSFRRQQLSGFAIFFVFSTCHCTSNTHKLQCVAAVPCRMVSSMLTNRLRPPRPRKSFNWARPLAAQPASEIMLTTSADMTLKLLPPPHCGNSLSSHCQGKELQNWAAQGDLLPCCRCTQYSLAVWEYQWEYQMIHVNKRTTFETGSE